MASGDDADYNITVGDMRKLDNKLSTIQSSLNENTRATKKFAESLRVQNDRLTQLEKKEGKKIPIDQKTITILAISAIVFMVLVVGGKEGLEFLNNAVNR